MSPREQPVLSTLNTDGSRLWIRPRPSRGRFATARRIVAYLLILLFTAIPYIQFRGKPLILLDITTRRFTILGTTFLPTDTLLLALFMVGVFVAVFLVTALLGRVWCGWACPQTVYMEFVFRPIERFFHGTPGSTRKGFLGGGAISAALKFLVYLLIAMYLAHTFLAYWVGVDQLAQWMRHSPLQHPAGFLVMACTTALMLFDFGIFREQTCILACPYGRFQSVMLDRQSLIISYDARRGEPRGKKTSGHQGNMAPARGSTPQASMPLPLAPSPIGDCVDCRLCVTTCPTGIDIREGLQMECIGCAQCIDACDAVMDKLGRSRGLIRYSSQAAMAGQRRRLLRPRIVVYPLILLIIAGLFGVSLARQGDADITVLRGLGKPFTELSPGIIGNPVRIKIVNRIDRAETFTVSASGPTGITITPDEHPIVVAAGESKTTAAMVTAPIDAFAHGPCDIAIHITDGRDLAMDVTYRLLGPGAAMGGSHEPH